MKKMFGILIILLIAISFSNMENFAIGQESSHTTNASVIGNAPYIEVLECYVVIFDEAEGQYWNSSTGTGVRSDSYMYESEYLEINAYITDPDGFFSQVPGAPSHSVEGIIRDITNYHSTPLNYVDMVDDDTALFRGNIYLYNSGMQDIGRVNITCYDNVDDTPASNNDPTIYYPLYINPLTAVTFNPDQVNWTGLTKGTELQIADDNPYLLNFEATCLEQDVDIGYDLLIRGDNLTSDPGPIIPIAFMNCTLNEGSYQSLSDVYTAINIAKIIANTGQNLNFYLSIPSSISAGDYSGNIDIQIDPEP